MLREVRSPCIRPRLVGLRYTTSSSTAAIGTGVGSAKITSAATGSGVISFTRGFGRRPIVVANASSLDIAAGGYVGGTTNTYATAIGNTLVTRNTAATADDGTAHVVILGYDSRVPDVLPYTARNNVCRCDFDQGIVKCFKVDTTNSAITINARNATFVKNAPGDVTLTFRSAFASTPVAVATPYSSSCLICMIDTITSRSVGVKVYNKAGTLTDGVFYLLVLGDGQGPSERVAATPLYSDQRKPIIHGCSIVYVSGVPTFDFNTSFGLTDTATGRTTFTWPTAGVAREAIVIATAIENTGVRYCTIDSATSSGFEVKQWSSAPALADCTDTSGFQLIVVGFQDASEY